ncbi:uncharacterized protein LOC121238699 isoform X2 [Juglans microcarpa x Juglans regia]|uniref:uncharacterized protein LOC121238699 isoform X2 n=1 Tax=Juglans microcarpa x Juglans regia TaxID=2249226 RepID=UPI001B7EE872|nr:uncharacterized protein LOC121238699 isoform X2 [Juglans microcarpa x Juglans regia]
MYANCVIASRVFWEEMEMAREHDDCIEGIRRPIFSIGGELMNTLNVDLHQAVKNLSAELDAKDAHFLMELIQNAEDKEYMMDPSLELVITCEDIMITPTGAPPATLMLIFNNDKVLSSENIDSICSFGRPIKKVGKRKRVYIGEKAAKCGRYNLLQTFWSTKIERTLNHRLLTLPVGSDSDGVLLSDRKIGTVRTTSHESVKKEEESMVLDVAHHELIMNQMNPKDSLIRKGLARLILGFLADHPMLKMEADHESRHEAMKRLLNTTFLEIVELKVSQMIGWDRSEASSMLYTQKLEKSSGYYKNIIEYATYFSQALISEGLLWENSDHDIGELSDLIKLCFVLEFNEEAVAFVMKSRNLQIFVEDEEFLTSLFL